MRVSEKYQKKFRLFLNWIIDQLSQLRAISRPTETMYVKSTPHIKVHINARLLRSSKKTSQVFANWLIGQLNQLMAISHTTEALEVKSMLHTKLN